MCGLFGLYLRNKQPIGQSEAEHILRLLAYFSQKRGDDSYGMWSNKGHLLKAPKDIRVEGLDDIKTMAKDLRTNGDWVMGHTRNATHGEVNYENSHPFQLSGLTLAHNGVVNVDGYTDKDHAVDSARILQSVVKDGWEKGMAKVSGSCGLIVTREDDVYIYQHNQSLNMVNLPWATIILSDSTSLKDLCYMLGIPKDKVEVVFPKDEWFWHVNKGGYTLHAPCKSYTYSKSTSSSSSSSGTGSYRDPEYYRTHHWDAKVGDYVPNDKETEEKEKKEKEAITKKWEGKFLDVPPFDARSTYMNWDDGMKIIDSLYNCVSMRAMYNIIKGLNWYQKDWLTLYWIKAMDLNHVEGVQGISDWGGEPFERCKSNSNTYGAPYHDVLNFALVWDLDDQNFWCIKPQERSELQQVPRKGKRNSCFEFLAASVMAGAWVEFVLHIMVEKWGSTQSPTDSSTELPVPDGDSVPTSDTPEAPEQKEEDEVITISDGKVVTPISNVKPADTQPLPVLLAKKGGFPVPLITKKTDNEPSEVNFSD